MVDKMFIKLYDFIERKKKKHIQYIEVIKEGVPGSASGNSTDAITILSTIIIIKEYLFHIWPRLIFWISFLVQPLDLNK